MTEFVGFSDNLYFFRKGDKGVLVDSTLNVIVASGDADVLGNQKTWESLDATSDAKELADLALNIFEPSITAAAPSRLYTIPKVAQEEAKKALEWRKEEKRGGTPVGLNTARILAKGGQIGLKKVRHIAKYFPRHEVDKQGKGWKPGEDGFPSNGRIAWALWGGDSAWRWARAIVEREDKKATTASGSTVDLESFGLDYVGNEAEGPEFIVRLFTDSLLVDRLYKVDPDGATFVWDDGQWSDLGEERQDIWSYDAHLDATQTFSDNKIEHVTVDPDSAIFIAGRLYERPQEPIHINEIDEVEFGLAADAIDEIDWSFIDQTILAAGEPVTDQDGNYTPEERSAKAKQQVRDKTGRFATSGSRVVIGGDLQNGAGQITKVNPAQQTVTVKLDNGQVIDVKGNQVEPESSAEPAPPTEVSSRIDTSGILAEPRTPANRGIAQIPGTLPAMTSKDLHDLLADWPAWVKSQREAYTPAKNMGEVKVQPKGSTNVGAWGEDFQKAVGKSLITDAYDHPLISKWLKKQDSDGRYPNTLWYNPITSAGEIRELTPQTSDVQPVYMAIVDPDDPRAVLNLVSLVPANSQSTSPMTYIRKNGKWVRDAKTLTDLKSATPPPVVPLDSETLNDVLAQVDETQSVTASLALTVLFGNEPINAAGGLDRNRGKAEELRRYWTKGAGAAKIRWGQPGDWKRCVRHLSKYMGVRAKGYCQLRHKEALGIYTSTHAKRDRAGENSVAPEEVIYDIFETEVTEEDMKTPISQIESEDDEMYDSEWEPDSEIAGLMEDIDYVEAQEYGLIAAGGLDRNRGNAEELRRYWTIGKGGAKIRWGTDGDWTRCYRNLKKYMGVRAKGYCALRHKEMDGFWPGEHNKQFVTNQFGTPEYTDSVLRSEEDILSFSILTAKRNQLKARVAGGFDSELGDVNVDVSTFFFNDPEEMPVEMDKILDEVEPVDEQEIDIEELIPSQKTVNMRRVEAVAESMKPVKVLITSRGPVLVDGHHRTVAHMLLGKDTVPAKIYKAEE